jgi:hypothetical protein
MRTLGHVGDFALNILPGELGQRFARTLDHGLAQHCDGEFDTNGGRSRQLLSEFVFNL